MEGRQSTLTDFDRERKITKTSFLCVLAWGGTGIEFQINPFPSLWESYKGDQVFRNKILIATSFCTNILYIILLQLLRVKLNVTSYFRRTRRLLMSFPWLAYNVSTLYSVNKYPCPNFTLIDLMYCSKTDLQYLFYLIDVST